MPVITLAIIGLTVVVFLLQLIPGLGVTNALLFSPAYAFGELGAQGVPYEPWRMVTAMFVHSDGGGTFFFMHILLNMYTLWIFGQVLETMLGRSRYLALYLLAGLGGAVAVFVWAWVVPATILNAVVGASGAIFGLMAAYLVIQRSLKNDTTGMLILVVINLVIGFLPGTNISWQAHIGGIIVGVVIGLVVATWRMNRRRQWTAIALTAVVLIAVALSHAPVFVGA